MDSLHLLSQEPIGVTVGWAVSPFDTKIPFNSWTKLSHAKHTNEPALGYLCTQVLAGKSSWGRVSSPREDHPGRGHEI